MKKQQPMTLKGINESIKASGLDAEIVRRPALTMGAGVHEYSVVKGGKKLLKGVYCRRMSEFSKEYWMNMAETA